MASERHDKELEQYRNLLETPSEFKNGFGWTTFAGIVFCGLIMMPGSIYMGLMFGSTGANPAAAWVTLILFMEIARRALQPMKKEQLVVLLHAARVIMAGSILFPGGPMGQLVFRAYLATSEAARDAGMTGVFPRWWCPPIDSPAITERLLIHKDWLAPIGLILFMAVIGLTTRYTMGYFFFRLTSDVENLPFPLAPIRAQGAMALAEADERVSEQESKGYGAIGRAGERKRSLRWRIFSLGVAMGISFGFFKVGIPAITGLFLSKPFYLIPQPYVDTTVLTESVLPATPTGVSFDLVPIISGFVLPFWSIVGAFIAIVITVVLNPVLHYSGVLTHWQPGMDTINTTFSNSIDFWLSFGIGTALGISATCIYATFRDTRAKLREMKKSGAGRAQFSALWETPEKGRGDYPLWIALAVYLMAATILICVSYSLLPKTFGVLFFLIFFAFLYNPFISYVNARLLGISGQNVDIPHIRETAFILSGARGVDIWLAPVPLENFGDQAQNFRVNELTGVSFWSLMRADLAALPILLILSLAFWAFIWKSDAIPSESFPAAAKLWELSAKQQVLMWSSTFVAPGENPNDKSVWDSPFLRDAIHFKWIGAGFAFCVVVYSLLSFFGLPIMLIYGMIRGFGQLPHFMVLEIVGAMLGRFYLRRKYGPQNFLRQAPTLMAGYVTGEGLIAMATIAMKLIKAAVSGDPF